MIEIAPFLHQLAGVVLDAEVDPQVRREVGRREGVAVMGNDVLTDRAFEPSESIVLSQIRSLLCVPLTVFGSKLGLIYADTTHPGAHLDEDHQ